MVLLLVGAFGMMFAIEKNKNNSLGGPAAGLHVLHGVMLSRLLGFVMGMSNGSQLVMTFGGTAIVRHHGHAGHDHQARSVGMQKFLFMGAVGSWSPRCQQHSLQLPALMLTISVMAIVIFSAFMLVDLQRVVNGGETNYVSATLAIYLDVQRLEPADAAGHLRWRPRIAASGSNQGLHCDAGLFRPAHHDEVGLTPCRYSKRKQQYQNPEHLRHARAHNDVTNKTPGNRHETRSRPSPCSLLAAQPAWAAYPERAITLIVPAAAGGNADITARLVGQEMSKLLGQPVVVENRVGAGGRRHPGLGAPADGYTIGYAHVGTLVRIATCSQQLYDLDRDLAPIGLVTETPNVIVVNAASPYRDRRASSTPAAPNPTS